MGPSHELQFFMNCSSLGLSQGAQSFRNRLLQCRFPVVSQVLPANLLQLGLLSPCSHRSCQEPALTLASYCGVILFWASSCSGVGSHVGCRWISVPPWTSTGCKGISALVSGAPPSALVLGSAGLLFSHILIHISQLLLLSFCPLKYAIPC